MIPLHSLPEDRFGDVAERRFPPGVAELTDPDGDALTITADAGGLWITCTTEGEEVTVGPFPVGTLREAVTAIGPLSRVA